MCNHKYDCWSYLGGKIKGTQSRSFTPKIVRKKKAAFAKNITFLRNHSNIF